jgi:hypothetical protein
MPTIPVLITALPPPPSTGSPADFDTKADAFLGALPVHTTETNTLSTTNYNNAVDAYNASVTATTQAALSAASASASASSAGAPLWVSGTTYTVGAAVMSPITYQIYRRTTAGAGTTDPSIDFVNWIIVSITAMAFRNKIVNGDMRISQRGTSFPAIGAASNAAYFVDRWSLRTPSIASLMTVSQESDVPASSNFQKSLRTTITTADTSIGAGDVLSLSHRIEGYNARSLIGVPFVLSFWVRSSKTGVHCTALQNNSVDRSYVFEYTVSAANTWEFKSLVCTAGLITAGGWEWTTATGLDIRFALAAGAAWHAATGAWQVGDFRGTANQVNCLDTVGNIFAITGVQLEPGAVATSFEQRPYGLELGLCQRYYYRIEPGVATNFGLAGNGTSTYTHLYTQVPVSMRVAPTTLEQSGVASDYSVSGVTCSGVPALSATTNQMLRTVFTVSSGLTAYAAYSANGNSTAYLAWSAEL